MSHRLHKWELRKLIGAVLKRYRATKTIETFTGTGIHQLVRVTFYHKCRFPSCTSLTAVSKNHNHIGRVLTTIVHLVQLVVFDSSFKRGIPALNKRHVLGSAFNREKAKCIFCSVVIVNVHNDCTEGNCYKSNAECGSEQPNFFSHDIFLLTYVKNFLRNWNSFRLT